MSKFNFEAGKYYSLYPNIYYFSIDLQRGVKFNGRVVVCLRHFVDGKPAIGTLVDVGGPGLADYDTENEIEFSENDVIEEYEFNGDGSAIPIFFMDM